MIVRSKLNVWLAGYSCLFNTQAHFKFSSSEAVANGQLCRLLNPNGQYLAHNIGKLFADKLMTISRLDERESEKNPPMSCLPWWLETKWDAAYQMTTGTCERNLVKSRYAFTNGRSVSEWMDGRVSVYVLAI